MWRVESGGLGFGFTVWFERTLVDAEGEVEAGGREENDGGREENDGLWWGKT